MRAMELEPGIHQMAIGREPFKGFPPPNAFLVQGMDASVLIDAGYDNPGDHAARMRFIEEAGGPPLSELVITHRHVDHGGGAMAIHRATGVPMACHALEREVIETERFGGEQAIARELQGGERTDLGGLTVEIVFAPGHTHGCLAVYVPERGALFTTDTVMQISTTAIRSEHGSLARYGETLLKFQEIGARVLYPGHGGPAHDPAARLQLLIHHRERREQELLDALAGGASTPPELREKIYVGLPEVRQDIAERQVVTGLAKLMEEGRAKQDGDHYTLI